MIGICFGGYCPMHRGHLDLIMRAKKENPICYVIVCGFESEPRSVELGISQDQRYALIKEFFKGDEQIKVGKINDTTLGIDESMSKNNWKIWTEEVIRVTKENRGDLKFYVAEERYKEELEGLGFTCTLCPKEIPVSATMIRKSPRKYWDYIVPSFRPKMTKKILIIGTASEGKSTLAQDIRRYFGIQGTEEYGRVYMERKNILDPDLTVDDFREFLIGQHEETLKALENPGNRGVIVCDTDNLVTLMYAYAYMKNPEMKITPEDYDDILFPLAETLRETWDHIILISPGAEFVDDGSRYMGQSSLSERQKNYEFLKSYLPAFYSGISMTELKGGDFYENFIFLKNYINAIP